MSLASYAGVTQWRPGNIHDALTVVPPKERVVLCHGVFDLLHLGHIRHLQQAKSWGDKLIVSVTADEHVNKGMGRPHFTAEQRVEALKALECVDEAFINYDKDPCAALRRTTPSIYVKGIDYTAGELPEAATCAELGIEIKITDTDKWSSSRLINSEKFPQETCDYLQRAREAGFLPRILSAFEAADKFKIAFVGETILDEYRYVSGLGKPAKENIIATYGNPEDGEQFYGGIVAASKHGEWADHDHYTTGLVCKVRYVDRDFNRKLFEVYEQKELDLNAQRRQEFNIVLQRAVDESDVVVMLDFGHGLMRKAERKIVQSAKFLALNSQSNAGNHGYNPVTLYSRADFVCIDDPEARLAVAMASDPIDHVVSSLSERIDCRKFLITHGRNGSFFYGDRYGHAPVLSANAVDTMGAGDAVIAVTGPLLAAGLGLEEAALVGNVVGAIKVSILGHRRHVNRQEIVQTLESLLK